MKIERILIVGLGSIGKRHASLLRQIAPDVVLIALRHRSHGDDSGIDIDHTVTSIESAIELNPQAAIIANPASCHLELELQLAALDQKTAAERETLHVLRAEWSFLNRPDRLAQLSEELLPHLQPPAAHQIRAIDRLPESLDSITTTVAQR